MNIHAVATIYNEGPIVRKVITHLLGNGVDRVWVAYSTASTDNTLAELLKCPNTEILMDPDDYHYQPKWTNTLIQRARIEGADWVIPFDADEFWYALDGRTIREALEDIPDSIGLLQAYTWLHVDMNYRQFDQQPWPKVCFRPREDTVITNGNHSVSGFTHVAPRILAIRELQFRDLAHMTQKSEERWTRLNPELAYTEGLHQRDIYVMSDDAKKAEWERRVAAAGVYDPIPYRGYTDES